MATTTAPKAPTQKQLDTRLNDAEKESQTILGDDVNKKSLSLNPLDFPFKDDQMQDWTVKQALLKASTFPANLFPGSQGVSFLVLLLQYSNVDPVKLKEFRQSHEVLVAQRKASAEQKRAKKLEGRVGSTVDQSGEALKESPAARKRRENFFLQISWGRQTEYERIQMGLINSAFKMIGGKPSDTSPNARKQLAYVILKQQAEDRVKDMTDDELLDYADLSKATSEQRAVVDACVEWHSRIAEAAYYPATKGSTLKVLRSGQDVGSKNNAAAHVSDDESKTADSKDDADSGSTSSK